MRGSGSPQHGSDWQGSLVILILVVFVWLLRVTWPWWLLLPLVGALVALAIRPAFRNRVRVVFWHEDVAPEIALFRRRAARTLFVIGIITTAICSFTVRFENLPWWLIPLVLIGLALRLRALSPFDGRGARFNKALCANLTELLSITVIVLACYSLALFCLQAVSLDNTTLGKLTAWEGRVAATHEFLERYSPRLIGTLALLAVILGLRIAASLRPSLAQWTNRFIVFLAGGAKWLGRISSAAAIAATLTFLATGDSGPTQKIGLTLRDAKQDYDHFQAALAVNADSFLRQALAERAWNQRPQPLREEMDQSAQFLAERRQYEDMRERAKDSSQAVVDAAPLSFPASVDVASYVSADDTGSASAEPPAPSWTPGALRQASEEADTVPDNGGKEPSVAEETTDELAHQAFEQLLPADRILGHSPLLSLLSTHYPVFGEFFDALNSSLTAASFDTLRSWVVRTVTEMRGQPGSASVNALMHDQAARAASTVVFDLRRFDESWALASAQKISNYRVGISQAKERLENLAAAEQNRKVEKAHLTANSNANLLDKVAAAVHSADLANDASAVRRVASELTDLSKVWPPLDPPDSNLEQRLAAIFQRFSDRQLVTPQDNADSHKIVSPLQIDLRWTSPLAAMVVLNTFCDTAVSTEVGKAGFAQTARLRQVLGERYQSYYDDWANERYRETPAKEPYIHSVVPESQPIPRPLPEPKRPSEEPIEHPEIP